ncbi:MAG: hypothetical protein AAB215_03995 [Planctomycetota bacterium]
MSGPDTAAAVRSALAAVRARARRVLALRGAAISLAALAVAALILALIEIRFRPALGVRVLLLGTFGLASAFALARTLVRPLVEPLSDAAIASLLEREFPFLASALVTSVDLSCAACPAADASFKAATDADALSGLERTEPRSIVRTFRARRAAALAAAAIGVFALFVFLDPRADLALRRSVLLRETPWPSRTRLHVRPEGVVTVARGDDLAIVATFSGSVPPIARLWVRDSIDGAFETLEVSGRGEARRVFHAISKSFEFAIEGGDAPAARGRVRVKDRPSVQELRFRIEPPAYTGILPSETDASADRIRAPAGSTIRVRGRSSCSLRDGALSGGRVRVPMEIRGDRFDGAWRLAESVRIEIEISDADGLAAKPPPAAVLEAVPDLAPRPAVSVPLRDAVLSSFAVLPIEASAEDDYGVADLRIRLERFPGGAGPGAPFERAAPAAPPPVPARRSFSAEIPLSETNTSPGDSIRILAAASDNDAFAGPKKAVSAIRAFEVLEPARVEALLERKILAFQEGLERRLSELESERAASAKALAGPEASRKEALRALSDRARALRSAARPLADDLELTLREMEIQRAGIPERRAALRADGYVPFRETVDRDLGALTGLWDAAALASDAPPAVASARAAEDRLASRWRAILSSLKSHSTFQEVVRTVRDMVDEQKRVREKTAADSEDRLDRILGPRK